jgi:CRP-like cAMP-binding protein
MDPIHPLPVFSGLGLQAARDVVSSSEERWFKRRQPLFRQGDPLTGLFLVRVGSVKLSQLGPNGQEFIMRLAGAGDLIAAVAAFDHTELFPVGATALNEVAALFWERSAARRLAGRHLAFAAALTREISRQAQGLQMRLREVATERVPQRLARVLLRLAEQAGVPRQDGVRIDIPLTRQDLAQMTGTTLYTVSRLLSEWTERGIVRTGRARVTLRSLRLLGEMAAADQRHHG